MAFARCYANETLVTVVPRFVKQKVLEHGKLRTCGWEDTDVILESPIEGAGLRDLLSGRGIFVASNGLLAAEEVFAECPVAVLYHPAAAGS
jgi:maltooligosyltrehalose synthase